MKIPATTLPIATVREIQLAALRAVRSVLPGGSADTLGRTVHRDMAGRYFYGTRSTRNPVKAAQWMADDACAMDYPRPGLA